jgi:hypothetical protein
VDPAVGDTGEDNLVGHVDIGDEGERCTVSLEMGVEEIALSDSAGKSVENPMSIVKGI